MLKHPGLVSLPFTFTLKGVQGDFLFFISLFFQMVFTPVDNFSLFTFHSSLAAGGVREPFELLLFVGEPPRIRLVPDVERVDMPPVMLFDLALLDADETERPVLLLLVVLDRADDLLRHFPVPFVFRPENGEADRPECDPYHDGRAQTPAAPLRQTRIRMSGNILKTILEIARFFQGGEIRQADFS